MDCIFCKIAAGDIPCTKVYEDEKVICFKDINPKAPIHVLVVPKKHIANLMEVNDINTLNDINNVIKHVAKQLKISESGFRTVVNTGHDGGQTVDHLHFHVLAGKAFGESFG